MRRILVIFLDAAVAVNRQTDQSKHGRSTHLLSPSRPEQGQSPLQQTSACKDEDIFVSDACRDLQLMRDAMPNADDVPCGVLVVQHVCCWETALAWRHSHRFMSWYSARFRVR